MTVLLTNASVTLNAAGSLPTYNLFRDTFVVENSSKGHVELINI